MNLVRNKLAISTVAWVVLAIMIVVVGGSAAYLGSYNAVRDASPNPSTTTVIQLEVSYSTVTYTTTVVESSITVYTITLASATLYGGTENGAIGGSLKGSSYIVFAVNNPHFSSNITGITLTGSGISSVGNWETSSGVSYFSNGNNALPASETTSFTFYPYGTSQSITTGQVFNYVIDFANGQSVSGSLIAQ